MAVSQKIKAFLSGMGSVVNFFPTINARPSRSVQLPQNPWAVDRQSLCDDFKRVLVNESLAPNPAFHEQ
jgi:hypothetical protein